MSRAEKNIGSSSAVSSQTELSTCEVCELIAKAMTSWPDGVTELKLGSWKRFLDRAYCVCCQTIVDCLRDKKPYETAFEAACPLTIHRFENKFQILSDSTNDNHGIASHLHPKLVLYPSKNSMFSMKYFVPVDSIIMDFDRIRLWPSYCDKNHGGSCHSLVHQRSITPVSFMILIDIQKCCLTPVRDEFKSAYVALSYVWGSLAETLETNTDNFNKLCLPGSLKEPNNLSRMPKTVLDAMTVAIAMNVKFLWVDRLCIVQDDPGCVSEQIKQMASIYRNSYFTIVASDGPDANYGLPGVCATSSPRSCSFCPKFCDFSVETRLMIEPSMEDNLNPPIWHSRAWTFQERALSPRNLVFTGGTVYWACQRAVWHETLAGDPEGFKTQDWEPPVPYRWPNFQVTPRVYPGVVEYFRLVSNYNSRNLTFDKDALNAFSAILTVMNNSFPADFHFGIPTSFFDLGLLWSRDTPLRRRKCFPSWSWLGWSGKLGLLHRYASPYYPEFAGFESAVMTRPVHDWYTTRPGGNTKFSIDNSYYRHRIASDNPDVPLPEGWVKTRHGFEHSTIPNHVFKFPFPTSSSIISLPSGDLSPYLNICSRLCTLHLGDYVPKFKESECIRVNLYDDKDHYAGIVESHFMSDQEYVRGCCCQFVAISCGSVERYHTLVDWPDFMRFYKMAETEDTKERSTYSFYNVLWIETIQGVSYRKAMGRVWKNVWEQQASEHVDILLG